jgi:hypothetical protein
MHDQVRNMCRSITCPDNWVENYIENDSIQLWIQGK